MGREEEEEDDAFPIPPQPIPDPEPVGQNKSLERISKSLSYLEI